MPEGIRGSDSENLPSVLNPPFILEKIKEIIDEEKSKVKQNVVKNTLFSATGFLSIYRILGYGFLIFGFFALNNNKILIPLAFIIGLSIVPIGVLFTKLIKK